MFVDFNRETVTEKFMLKGSDHTFIGVNYQYNYETLIIDIDDLEAYRIDELLNGFLNFGFYRKDDDEDYLGVWVIE